MNHTERLKQDVKDTCKIKTGTLNFVINGNAGNA